MFEQEELVGAAIVRLKRQSAHPEGAHPGAPNRRRSGWDPGQQYAANGCGSIVGLCEHATSARTSN